MLKGRVKAALRFALPFVYRWAHDIRQRSVRKRLDRVTALLSERLGLRVLAGPFAGMNFTTEATVAHFPPKLLGAYEAELHDVLSLVLATPYATILDVGCAEGYYAVGLALRHPDATVYAFDTDRFSRQLCHGMAEANGVEDRMRIEGECTHERLSALDQGRVFLLSDCEGYEKILLDFPTRMT
jgi:methylase of polypeptide subunit release factors